VTAPADPMVSPAARCPACDSTSFDPCGEWRRCVRCGLAKREAAISATRPSHLSGSKGLTHSAEPLEWLRGLAERGGELDVRLPNGDSRLPVPVGDAIWRYSPRAAVQIAERAGLASLGTPLSGPAVHLPWFRLRLTTTPPPTRQTPVSLIILCCHKDQDQAASLATSMRRAFDEIVIVVDADEPPAVLASLAASDENAGAEVRVVCRRLNGDFAAQRNAAIEAAGCPWVLHLDADERPDPALLTRRDRLIDHAQRHRLAVLGLPRVNWVDGVRSEVYPDHQYRLHRADQRWTRPVHEVPEACERRWREVRRLPGDHPCVLHHDLTRAGLQSKAEFYETIESGMGRTEGIQAILGGGGDGDAASDGGRAHG